MAELVADKILFTGVVKDNEDVLLLNRIRVFPETKEGILEVLRGLDSSKLNESENDIKDEYKFTKDDPFVYLPLLPFSISIVPKIDELVWTTYSNPKTNGNGRVEQFYIPALKSNILNIEEDWKETKTFTSQGFNLLSKPKLKLDVVSNEKGKKPYRFTNLEGLFAEPGDNAFYSQGPSDIIMKPYEILLRAGKSTDFLPNPSDTKPNEKRAFFQLSYFKSSKKKNPSENVSTNVIDNSTMKKIIEYDIINLENNTSDSFTGEVYIYDLPSNPPIPNDQFTSSTLLPPTVTTKIFSYPFQALPMSSVTEIINTVINQLNDTGTIEIKDPYTNVKKIFDNARIFPFFYRPSQNIRNLLNLTPDLMADPMSLVKISNASNLVTRVKYSGAFGDIDGSGLVSRKNKFGISKKKIQKQLDSSELEVKKESVSVLGSSKILFLSYDSNKPISSELNDKSIYGLSPDTISNLSENKTSSLVRGDELKELLNLIVKFLTTHCHGFHGLPPVPVSFSSVSVPQIETEMQLYDSKVLNQNIRIN